MKKATPKKEKLKELMGSKEEVSKFYKRENARLAKQEKPTSRSGHRKQMGKFKKEDKEAGLKLKYKKSPIHS